MNNTTIFSTEDLPNRRIGLKAILSNPYDHKDLGYAIQTVKRDMSMKLAGKMFSDNTFFSTKSDNAVMEVCVDCIVLTISEYADMKREAFKQGVEHANHFIPSNY